MTSVACGAGRQTIIALEAGRDAPSLEPAFRIVRAFAVEVEEVFPLGIEMNRWLPLAGIAGAVVFAAAALGFGAALPGFSHVTHPVAVLGAKGVPHANAFNLLGLMLPGLLASTAMLALRRQLPRDAGWATRIGAQLLLLSALGVVALGLLPLDPADLHNPASSYHATAWMLWWVAFVPGALLLALGLRGRNGWWGLGRACVLAAVGLLYTVLFAVDTLPAGIAQRLGFAIWWLWVAFAGWAAWRASSRAG